MKRWIVWFVCVCSLCGCSAEDGDMQRALALRAGLMGKTIQFEAQIMADYGDLRYEFSLECTADAEGKVEFTVLAPETIAGIRGCATGEEGKLTFEDTVLAFPVLADGLISPVAAPWVMMHTLRSGYISACGQDDGGLRLTIEDSYQDDALHLEIWLDGQDLPKEAEIYWQGRRLLSVAITNFQIR